MLQASIKIKKSFHKSVKDAVTNTIYIIYRHISKVISVQPFSAPVDGPFSGYNECNYSGAQGMCCRSCYLWLTSLQLGGPWTARATKSLENEVWNESLQNKPVYLIPSARSIMDSARRDEHMSEHAANLLGTAQRSKRTQSATKTKSRYLKILCAVSEDSWDTMGEITAGFWN